MKRIAIAAAFSVSATAFNAALADSDAPWNGSSFAASERRWAPSQEGDETRPRHMAEGFFDHFREDRDRDHHRHHHWDDDDDDGSASADHSGANRPADPNAAAKPVPDSGVFNGNARPKVEVQ